LQDAICSNKASTTRALSTIREILGQSPQSIEKANAIFSSAAGQQQQQYSGSCGGGSGERRIEAMKQNYLDRLKGLQISLRFFPKVVEAILCFQQKFKVLRTECGGHP
jgi:hypothetical protein